MVLSRLLKLLLVVVVSGATAEASKPDPKLKNLQDIIEAWAPLVWLHPEEVFFPSSVDFHFQHTEVKTSNETVVQTSPDRYTVLTGPDTSDMHLNSVPDLDCPDCLLDWFAGENATPVKVSTYVFIRDYNDSCGTVDVVYRSFYPYNYGKDVCVDWEHYSIRIRNNKVTKCYVSVHSFGASYTWNDTTNNFQFLEGEESRVAIDVINVTYPKTVEVVEGFHAELFSANGSHGLWSQLGTHEYVHFPIHLRDQTERGYPWRTWENLEVVNYDPDTEYEGELHYLGYRGRWGNLKRGCEVFEVVSGECILDSGPGFWRPWPSDFPNDCPDF
ncbi:vacuolar protein sorting-associated protein TDA6-like 2 [Homarus americanus]|uniref:Vacuolar protein sorting-associated protein TDA6-like 2 n=1 Tax=Homarus americanus TaxID=6706 RepID=A0A8J5K3Z3_HOMAM|nr:vacuolar protein sorting-associated protein TDA6-like 2 [Homarus americanus]